MSFYDDSNYNRESYKNLKGPDVHGIGSFKDDEKDNEILKIEKIQLKSYHSNSNEQELNLGKGLSKVFEGHDLGKYSNDSSEFVSSFSFDSNILLKAKGLHQEPKTLFMHNSTQGVIATKTTVYRLNIQSKHIPVKLEEIYKGNFDDVLDVCAIEGCTIITALRKGMVYWYYSFVEGEVTMISSERYNKPLSTLYKKNYFLPKNSKFIFLRIEQAKVAVLKKVTLPDGKRQLEVYREIDFGHDTVLVHFRYFRKRNALYCIFKDRKYSIEKIFEEGEKPSSKHTEQSNVRRAPIPSLTQDMEIVKAVSFGRDNRFAFLVRRKGESNNNFIYFYNSKRESLEYLSMKNLPPQLSGKLNINTKAK